MLARIWGKGTPYTAGGMLTGTNTVKISMDIPQKTKMRNAI